LFIQHLKAYLVLNKHHYHINCNMKKANIFILSMVAILSLAVFIGCKKGEPIEQPNRTTYKFTTYTLDTFQFKIVLNGVVLTDTLRSPISVANFSILFSNNDTIGSLQILNAISGQLYIDTTLTLEPIATTISIVQFDAGGPIQLAPIPNEPAPGTGNYKIRFQFRPPNPGFVFLDSIKCVLRLSGAPIDTIVLSQYEYSRFYESTLGENYNMIIYDASNNNLVDNTTNTPNSVNLGFTDFNTMRVYGISNTNYLIQRIY
jgi:hypothetical protein